MTFKEASEFIMPIGQYKGRKLDSIASTDKGLQYLDWLYGQRQGCTYPMDEALSVYMSDPTIKKELETL